MKINLDGTIDIEKGEKLPFICPKCNWVVEFDSNVFMVRCTNCKYLGQVKEFSRELKKI